MIDRKTINTRNFDSRGFKVKNKKVIRTTGNRIEDAFFIYECIVEGVVFNDDPKKSRFETIEIIKEYPISKKGIFKVFVKCREGDI